jgi:hypothetical protein
MAVANGGWGPVDPYTASVLTQRDEEVIRAALAAAVDGPFFPDWEFHALFGLERDDVRQVLLAWPSRRDRTAALAVKNALNNITGYPHRRWDAWPAFSDATKDELVATLRRWRAEVGLDQRGASDRTR